MADGLGRENGEAASQAFEGAKGKMIRRISDDCSLASYRKAAENMTVLSPLQDPIAIHVFTKPAVVRKRKDPGPNALGIVTKKKTSLVSLCGNRKALVWGFHAHMHIQLLEQFPAHQ